MLYTLMTPEQGAVNVDGLDARHHADAVRRSLGVLPDARGVYKRLTARATIAYLGGLHGMTTANHRARTARLVARLEIGEFIDRQRAAFSHAQRTKQTVDTKVGR